MVRIYRSYCQWPITWCRLRDGWMIRFFQLTILIESKERR